MVKAVVVTGVLDVVMILASLRTLKRVVRKRESKR